MKKLKNEKKKSNIEFLISKMNNRNSVENEVFIYSVLEELCKKNNIAQKFCPICGNESDFFLPYGENPRKNAQCPYCLSLERNRLLYLFFKYSNLIKSKTKMLYVSPEYSLHNYFKNLKNIEYSTTNKSFDDEIIDLKNINLKNNYFDIIVLSQSTNFIDNEKKCKKVYDITKNNGALIFLDNPDNDLKNVLDKLNKIGFEVNEFKYSSFGDQFLFERYSLEKSSIFVCKKSSKYNFGKGKS